MRAVDIIAKKRDGGELSASEISHFIQAYVRDEIADYQAAALLMAVFLRGMNRDETAALTSAMMASGDVYNLDDLGLGLTVDKHSTGGVGDKISLLLAPLVAACGVAVPMVSGRGLGHTGGTLDKLESIPGFNVWLSESEFKKQLQSIGMAMCGQTASFVPADRKLYALRDVTATVESIPLICASIMSKKLASGANAIVMDVKMGSGAFMPTLGRARELALGLIEVGRAMKRPVRALITDMSQPLGHMIGNSLEVIETLDCLSGSGPADVRDLTLALATEMIELGRKVPRGEAANLARQALESGAALKKFGEMVAAQGGDPTIVESTSMLDIAPGRQTLRAMKSGYVAAFNCREIGNAAVILGAGRARTTDPVDFGVGLEMKVRLGDQVSAGQPLAIIYHRDGHGLSDCEERLLQAIRIESQPPAVSDLIIEVLS